MAWCLAYMFLMAFQAVGLKPLCCHCGQHLCEMCLPEFLVERLHESEWTALLGPATTCVSRELLRMKFHVE